MAFFNRKTQEKEPKLDPQTVVDVKQENEMLFLGRKKMPISGVLDIRYYAQLRSGLDKKEKDLSEKEKVWRLFYSNYDKAVEQALGPEQKRVVDKIDSEIRATTSLLGALGGASEVLKVKDPQERMSWLGKLIDEHFQIQSTYISVHFDDSTGYKKKIDSLLNEVSDKTKEIDPEKKKDLAFQIQKLVKGHRETISRPAKTENVVIQKLILELEKGFDELSGEKRSTKLKDWVDLTKVLYAIQTTAVNYILASEDSDEFLGKWLVKNAADLNAKVPTDNLNEYALATDAFNATNAKREEVSLRRKNLGREIFGIE